MWLHRKLLGEKARHLAVVKQRFPAAAGKGLLLPTLHSRAPAADLLPAELQVNLAQLCVSVLLSGRLFALVSCDNVVSGACGT